MAKSREPSPADDRWYIGRCAVYLGVKAMTIAVDLYETRRLNGLVSDFLSAHTLARLRHKESPPGPIRVTFKKSAGPRIGWWPGPSHRRTSDPQLIDEIIWQENDLMNRRQMTLCPRGARHDIVGKAQSKLSRMGTAHRGAPAERASVFAKPSAALPAKSSRTTHQVFRRLSDQEVAATSLSGAMRPID